MSDSPKVIFNCRFTHAFNRKEAGYTSKQIENLKKKIARKFDYFSNEEKRVMNLLLLRKCAKRQGLIARHSICTTIPLATYFTRR